MSTCKSRLLIELKDSSRIEDVEIKLIPSLAIFIPLQYPMLPPSIKFITPIFHPNVNFLTGEVCIDVIKDNWTPAWTIHAVCRAVLSILCDPNPDSPLNCDAGNILRWGDVKCFNNMARMYSLEYAENANS
ncbi:Ubiquitin-conjugating enzyme family protein [Cryptosporidium felis]|nr:Ubiquitin-conjugating enzyme family protein [Cryptosporidium felis]